jgi:hypothetical protein
MQMWTRRFRSATLALTAVAVLAGCASTRLETEWRDPQYTGPPLVGNKVLVVCRVPDETLRRVCEDQWAMQLGTRGVTALRSYSLPGFPAGGAATAEQVQAALRSSGAIAVTNTDLGFSVVPVVRPAPVVGVGVGGGAWGGGGGFSTGGIGISLPIGGGVAQPAQSIAATTGVTSARTNALIWSGTATSPASSNASAQVSDLIATTVDAIGKSGLL